MKRRIRNWFYLIAFIAFINIIATGCTKDMESIEVPVLMTYSVTNTGQTTATCGGIITFNGGAEITARGVCWSTEEDPTISDNKTIDGTGSGSFISTLDNLDLNTGYYVKAYAKNSAGTGYGNELSFTTSGNATGSSTGTERDIEDNLYKTIVIGTQTWMAENLELPRLMMVLQYQLFLKLLTGLE